MKKEHIFLVFFLFVTLLSFYLLYTILSPFLESILWAILLAMVLYPLFRKLHVALKKKSFLSALLMTLLVVLVIILPLSLLIIALANEMVGAYHSVQDLIESGRLKAYVDELRQIRFLEAVWLRLDRIPGFSSMDPLDLLLKNLTQVSTFLFNQSSKVLKGLSTFVVTFIFTLLSLYYLFKDGHRLLEGLKEVLPIPSRERDLLTHRFKGMVRATIYGGLLIAIIQGMLGGLAFFVLGLPSPILWGTAMAFLSFIPIGGTALIWAPACILLFVTGAFVKGIILLAIGILIIGMVDNLLRPAFISSKTNIHPLLLFFAVLGGMQAFGLVGLIVGPLIATLCLTLLEIYIQGINPRSSSYRQAREKG